MHTGVPGEQPPLSSGAWLQASTAASGFTDVGTVVYGRSLRTRGWIIFLSLTYWLWLYCLESAIYTEDLSATLGVPSRRNWVQDASWAEVMRARSSNQRHRSSPDAPCRPLKSARRNRTKYTHISAAHEPSDHSLVCWEMYYVLSKLQTYVQIKIKPTISNTAGYQWLRINETN